MMSEERIEELVRRLEDFRTRGEAADTLVSEGEEAVEALLDALQRGAEGTRWVILNCLGEIGSEEAVPAIAEYLENPDYQTVARDSLIKIAGRDLGPMPQPWLRWAAEEGAARAGAAAEELSDRELVERAIQGSEVKLERETGDRFLLDVPVPEGRQPTWIVFGSTDHEGAEVVIVFANCGPAHAENYEAALRMNLRLPYGAVALRENKEGDQFVVFNTILRAALSPVELAKSVFTVAERSDHVARRLCR